MTNQEAYKKLELAIGIGKDRVELKFNQLKQELNEKILNTSNEKLKGIFVTRLNEVETAYAVLLESFDSINPPPKKQEDVVVETNREKKIYYFYNGTEREGPVSLSELKANGIKSDTLIWYEGLSDWKEAGEIEELAELSTSIPPPINKHIKPFDDSNSTPENSVSPSQINSVAPFTDSSDTRSEFSPLINSQSMFARPFSFEGRIRRTEYGLTLIIYVIVYVVIAAIISNGVMGLGLAYIPLVWFLWAQGAKRCHDLGNSGWWQIIPFYVFWLIFQDGEAGVNQDGNNPKE